MPRGGSEDEFMEGGQTSRGAINLEATVTNTKRSKLQRERHKVILVLPFYNLAASFSLIHFFSPS
jgi:hypothetical protein